MSPASTPRENPKALLRQSCDAKGFLQSGEAIWVVVHFHHFCRLPLSLN